MAQVLAGGALLGGLVFTWLEIKTTQENLRISQKTAGKQLEVASEALRISQEGQISERFTRAIEQLGSDRLPVRLGGIYALERIARDSETYHWPIMEILTAYVREITPWQGDQPPTLRTDIQGVLIVIGRRARWYKNGESQRLDLRGVDLRGLSFENAHLEGADLRNAHLEETDLKGAFLQDAMLWGTHLEKANLSDSNLQGIYFRGTHLEGAEFFRADLRQASVSPGVNLKGTKWTGAILEGADLSNANLQRAHFYGVTFKGVNLREADLTLAFLKRADLEYVVGLTWEQLSSAKTYEEAQLPDYLSKR